MVDRIGSGPLTTVKATMWHTVLCLDLSTGDPSRIAITTNPLEFDDTRFKAQIVVHKTRSQNCAVQVARYARRLFEIGDATIVHRSTRPLEAMIGYACTRTMTYPPSYVRDEFNEIVRHVAATPIAALLEEVRNGVNASRTRYIVYEVRAHDLDGRSVRFRGVTNKMHSVERAWRQCPPDTLRNADIVHVGKFATREEAEAKANETARLDEVGPLWTRRPSPEYMRRILRLQGGDVLWTADGTSAVRPYENNPVVAIGPHVYTKDHVIYCLERGAWYDGYMRRAPKDEDLIAFNEKHSR